MKPLVVLCVLGILTSCMPQMRTYSDADPDYDIWNFKTFDWGEKVKIEEGKNLLHYNELNDKRIKSAVQEQMTMRGYQLTIENPDLILHYHIVVEDQSIVTTEPYGYSYGPYWTGTQNLYLYKEGTLILDLMDRKTKNLIWRGWVVTEIDGIDQEKLDDLIKIAIARIFKKYPTVTGKTKAKAIVTN